MPSKTETFLIQGNADDQPTEYGDVVYTSGRCRSGGAASGAVSGSRLGGAGEVASVLYTAAPPSALRAPSPAHGGREDILAGAQPPSWVLPSPRARARFGRGCRRRERVASCTDPTWCPRPVPGTGSLCGLRPPRPRRREEAVRRQTNRIGMIRPTSGTLRRAELLRNRLEAGGRRLEERQGVRNVFLA